MISGIYQIINRENGKRYVGSAENIYGRWKNHLQLLRNGRHSKRFQNAYYKYGEKSFYFLVIVVVKDKTRLVPIEQVWLDHYKSYLPKNGYNTRKIAKSNLGIIPSDESKRKMSISHLGQISPMKGKKHSEKTKQLMGVAAKGRISPMKGKKASEKSKQLMSIAKRGKYAGDGNPNWGKTPSEKTKQLMRAAKLGKPLSEDHKRNLSLAGKERWKNKKLNIQN
jgi:group I intron endonuclease